MPSHRKYRLRLARYAGITEAITSFLDQHDSALKLLEVGSGTGRSLAFYQVAGIADRLELWGIDTSQHRIKTIYEPSRWKLTLGDAQEGLPYEADFFDVCICEQVLEHLKKPEKVIDEMVRVLRPGGMMVVGVPIFLPGIANIRSVLVAFLDRFFGIKSSHIQTFTQRSITTMVCEGQPLQVKSHQGFRIVSGGILSWLEDYKWWYLLNRRIGKTLPWLCTEVQIVLHKTNGSGIKPPSSK
ncbi:MAG: class I SAM-dependent methyltransferase [Rhodohalobacter sp.]|uniref:class I SAM-dependent methyltransferase n=1 Tax=Rhodohalobacter sp. TaxID=1974210 RepID=UPI0039758C72